MSISHKLLSILDFEINFVLFGFIAVFSPCASQCPPPPDATHKLCKRGSSGSFSIRRLTTLLLLFLFFISHSVNNEGFAFGNSSFGLRSRR